MSDLGEYHMEGNMATGGTKPTTLQLWTKKAKSFSNVFNIAGMGLFYLVCLG